MSKGKFALMVGLLAGAATGVLFTPTNGKKFRDKLKKEIKKGGTGKNSLYKHFKDIAEEIKDSAADSLQGTKIEKKVKSQIKSAKSTAKKAKSAVRKSVKIAKSATKEIKSELKDVIDND